MVKNLHIKFLFISLVLFACSLTVWADEVHGSDLLHSFALLSLQLGFILFAGHVGSVIAKRLFIPAIVGEVTMGIIISPHLLGSIPLPMFPGGLFPISVNPLSISNELFAFAIVASIVLLFLTGLQTDLRLFVKFIFKGSFLGLSSAVLSLFAGIAVGLLYAEGPVLNAGNLVLGAVLVVTSIDISARILGERRKMGSPEAVTILSASVFEEIIAVSLIAIAASIGTASLVEKSSWRCGIEIAVRALFIWVGFTAIGIILSRKLGFLFKKVRGHAQIAVLSLGLALIVSGLFETAGLALVIGAYAIGLVLGNTDISYVIQEKVETIHHFFDPIFFVVIGMIVNVRLLISSEVLFFGLLLGLFAWLSKLIGCGVPAYFSGFTGHGAMRIATGMVPRGEVALILGTIALGSEIIDQSIFDLIVVMTLFTTLTAPPLFNRMLLSKKKAVKKDIAESDYDTTIFKFGSSEITSFILQGIIETMQNEEFFVNKIHTETREYKVYEMRKDIIFINMVAKKDSLHFFSRKVDVALVINIVYDVILTLQIKVHHIKSFAKPLELQKHLAAKESRVLVNWYKYLSPECIDLDLSAKTKDEAILALISLLSHAGKITDIEEVKEKVYEREASMSTGMQKGLALPHARSTSVRDLSIAVGISRNGIDFDSLDKLPSHFIFLVISPQDHPSPHVQVLAGIAGILNNENAPDDILKINIRKDLIDYFQNATRDKKAHFI